MQFASRSVALADAELESFPVRLRCGAFDQLVEMIEPAWRADEQCPALFIGQGWPQNLGPRFASDGGVLVQDQEVEAVATKRVIVIGAA
jgi:hypothetical protein